MAWWINVHRISWKNLVNIQTVYKFQTTQETHYNRLEFIGNKGNNKSIQTTKKKIAATATLVTASVTQDKKVKVRVCYPRRDLRLLL